jgi:hypothetical protein
MNTSNEFTVTGGHLSDEGIALYVDALKLGTVSQLPGTMRAHVADCDRCQGEVTGLFAVLGKEDYSGLKQHPYFQLEKGASDPTARWIWRAAAAIAAVILLPGLVYYLVVRTAGGNLPPTGAATVQGDTSTITPPAAGHTPSPGGRELAANITPNPELEELVVAGTRSTSLHDVVPANGAVLSGKGVRFAWSPRGAQPWRLIIMDSAGQEVYSARITALPHRAGKKLGEGLYYWKVLDEQEALYFGKFSVREAGQFPRSTNPAQK